MQLPDSAAVNAWREFARADLRVAQVVAGLEPPEWHLVCFLSQQAGEKALKASPCRRVGPDPRQEMSSA